MHCAKSVPEGNLDQSAPLVRETMTFINNAITKGDRIVPYSPQGAGRRSSRWRPSSSEGEFSLPCLSIATRCKTVRLMKY